jgi:hypothetical protein
MSGYLVLEGYLAFAGCWLCLAGDGHGFIFFSIIIDKNILQLHLIRLGWDDSLSYVVC